MCGWQLKIANFLLLYLLFVSQVDCDCDLTEQQLNDCAGVITLNGQLLRTTKIKTGEKLNIYPIDGETPIKNIMCKNGRVKDEFSPDFPSVQKKNKCAKNILLIKDDLGFDSNCHGNVYNVSYNIEGTFIELYRTCYDRENYIARYTEGYIYAKDGASAKRPKCGFTLDEIMTGYIQSSMSQAEVKKTFGILYQSKYSIGNKTSGTNLDRGHLTPADDYPTFAQKLATFKMFNVFPQFHQVNAGNWYEIEKYIRTLAKNNKPRIFVQTGTHEVLKLYSSRSRLVPTYLHYNNTKDKWKFPVPAWSYKLVKDNQNEPIFASITLNNPFATQIPTAPSFCKTIDCSIYNLSLSTEASHGITYCCKPDEFTPVFHQPTDVSCRGLRMSKPNDHIPSQKDSESTKRGGDGQGPSTKRQKSG